MSKAIFTAFAVAGLMLAVPAAAQQKTIVSFAKGTSATTLKGSIKGDQDASYLVNARAGQTMTVSLAPSKGSPYMNITAPGATSALFIGSTEGDKFSGELPVDGRYTITVYQMRATARRDETASFGISIGVTGGASGVHASPVHTSHDALVPGTSYNATAEISCVTAAGAKPGACQAGVIRKGGGDATVELKTPDGGERKIYFTKGKASGSDAATPIEASRAGDTTTVRIGTVEVYFIPDALVFGG